MNSSDNLEICLDEGISISFANVPEGDNGKTSFIELWIVDIIWGIRFSSFDWTMYIAKNLF